MLRIKFQFAKNLLTCVLILISAQVFSQCEYRHQTTQTFLRKGKYEKAIVFCNKTIMYCDEKYAKAMAWKYLMDIYREYLPDDSLYIVAKKNLIRLGYEYPIGHRTITRSIDGSEFEPPDMDLYGMSRELCSELFERGQYDSAYFYFTEYALHYSEKGWCGVGKEFNSLYNNLKEAVFCFGATNSVNSLKPLLHYLDQDYTNRDNYYDSRDHLIFFCFYDIFHSLFAEYKKGDLLNEMETNLRFGGCKNGMIYFSSSILNEQISFNYDRVDSVIIDTMGVVKELFRASELYKAILFKDMITFDSVVRMKGRISDFGDEVFIFGKDARYWLDGISQLDESWKNREMEVTGELEVVPLANGEVWWQKNKLLLFPEDNFKRIIKNPVIKISGMN